MTLRRPLASFAMLTAGAALFFAALSHAASSTDGGTFKVSLAADLVPNVDPALGGSYILLDATCAHLMNFPDAPPPAALRLVPEVATAYPRVSRDGTTYTFTLHSGFRFSDGTPVQPSAFKHAIERVLAPGVDSYGAQYVADIVGAAAFHKGNAGTVAGVVATGNRLTVRFTRPVPDFPAMTTMPYFCAVPPTLPSDPEGVDTFPGSGPYTITEFIRESHVVLERNTYYRGARPHHVDRFVVDLQKLTPQGTLRRIERGAADWGVVTPPAVYYDPALGLARKYGVNRSQFFVTPGATLRGYQLNVARPLFHDNLALRQAVNFAVDRPAIVRQGGLASSLLGRPTDQYIPPSMPGFRDAHIYPLRGPDLQRARALARGHTRGGKAVLGTPNYAAPVATAQVLKQNLAKIGLDVEVKILPPGAYFAQASIPGTPFDITLSVWIGDYIDPSQYVSALFDGRFIGSNNFAHLDSPKYNALMRSAARLQGVERYRAYGLIDVQLARDVAPMIAVDIDNDATLVSKRVGCIIIRPGFGLDMTAVCLK